MTKTNLPIVAIVGRPNVGKSALFNRLVGEPISIVEDQPGVTRDRIYAETTWNGRDFELVDTAGMILDESEATVQRGKKGKPSFNLTNAPQSDRALRAAILEHARVAVEESTIVLFLVDGLAGVHGLEEDIATMLRKSKKPVLLVVNKLDNLAREVEMADFYRLALGEPWPVSALHGLGTGDLLDEVVRLLPPVEVEEAQEGIKLAIVGRPNVGKSSLLNTLLGEERAIVDDVPGTTRDPLDTRLEVDGEAFVLIDTAGLRRRARVDDKVEYYSGVRSLRAIARCDIAMLVIDAEEGVLAQDKRVAGHIQEESKAVIVLVNKWDRVRSRHGIDEASARRAFARDLAAELNFMTYAPVLFVSAQTEEGLEDLFPLVRDVYGEYSRRIETAALNRVVQEAAMMRPAPTFKGEQLKIYFASQKGVQPPEFVFKVNSIHLLHFSYKRYLENHIRRAFGLMGTPIRLTLKPKGK